MMQGKVYLDSMIEDWEQVNDAQYNKSLWKGLSMMRVDCYKDGVCVVGTRAINCMKLMPEFYQGLSTLQRRFFNMIYDVLTCFQCNEHLDVVEKCVLLIEDFELSLP